MCHLGVRTKMAAPAHILVGGSAALATVRLLGSARASSRALPVKYRSI